MKTKTPKQDWIYGRRDNARRGAERALTDGTAPGVDYAIMGCPDGFQVVWKEAEPEAPVAEAQAAAPEQPAKDKAVQLGEWVGMNKGTPAYRALAFASTLGDFRTERFSVKTQHFVRVHFDDESSMGVRDDDETGRTLPAVRLVPEEGEPQGPMTLVKLSADHPEVNRDMAHIVECVLAGKTVGTAAGNVVPVTIIEAVAGPRPGPRPKAGPPATTAPRSDWGKNLWPDGTEVEVRLPGNAGRVRATIVLRYQPQMWRVKVEGGGETTVRANRIFAAGSQAEAKAKATSAKAGRKAGAPQASPDEKPVTPTVTSAANAGYQKRFDKIAELGEAGDLDGLEGYEVKGVNTYAKMVEKFRQQWLAHLRHVAAPKAA